MTHVKLLAVAAAIAGGLGFASAANASPLTPASTNTVLGENVTNVAFGCGPGFAPGRFGGCRPIVRPFYGPRRFYGPRPYYGPRRFYGPRRGFY